MITTELQGILSRSKGNLCRIPFPVTLVFNPEEPFAVTMVMDTGDDVVEWTFSRDLMALAMARSCTTGEGDVRFTRRRSHLTTRLESPEGIAEIQLPIQPVDEFLVETVQEVARNIHLVDSAIDRLIEEILQ